MPLMAALLLAFALAGLPPTAGRSAPVVAKSGDTGPRPAALCVAAAQTAARETGVPLPVLLALALTETGRRNGAMLEPWPWALNVDGASHWLPDRASAAARAAELHEAGARNIDLGCFQINHRWHGAAFPSLEAMLDPGANALYAARFIASLKEETGDWVRAAGAYHSRTEVHAARYRARFEVLLAAVEGRMPDSPAAAPASETAEAGRARAPAAWPLAAEGEGAFAATGSLVSLANGDAGGVSAVFRPATPLLVRP